LIPFRSALIAGLVAALAAQPARAALWVSPGGDDRNPGTEEEPVRTIGRAREIVRTLNRAMSDDVTVFITGTYRLSQPLEFGPDDAGTNGFSVVYTAAPGEHPVFSGAVPVTGWKLSDAKLNLWSAPAPEGLADTRDLFVNGAPARRTRVRVSRPAPTGGQEGAGPNPWALWRNPADVELIDGTPDAIWSERAGSPPRYAENAFELLGRPGEWYFDRAARRVYYSPRPGEYLATADVEAAVAPGLIACTGSIDRPVAGMIFKGIRFEYTASLAASQPPSAAVRFTFAGNIQFLEDEFVHLGTPALDLGPGIAEAIVEGCLFGDISRSALEVAEASDVRVTSSRFSYIATGRPAEAAIEVRRSQNVGIEHCQIDHFPGAAIESAETPPGAIRDVMNRVAPPVMGPDTRGPPVAGSGIPAAYEGLLDEQLSAPSAPEPPTTVSAEPEDSFAYVTWDPPCLDGGAPVSAYTVTASTGAKLSVPADAFNARGYVRFEGLENDPDTGVTFTVTATNDLGPSLPSLPSAPVVPKHKRRLKPPPPPAAVTISIGAGGAWIKLTPAASNGGSPVVAYALGGLPAAGRMVLEGRDVIHSDPDHRVVRALAPPLPPSGAAMSVTATNAAGEGKPAPFKWP
jgi:hypothetical protein